MPINDEIYNGLPDPNAITSTKESTEMTMDKDAINDLISEEDSFHPNNLGYQIIANAFRTKIEYTKDVCLK